MLTDAQLDLIFAKVAKGSGLRDAIRFVAGKELDDKMQKFLIDNGHHVTYLEAKMESPAKVAEAVEIAKAEEAVIAEAVLEETKDPKDPKEPPVKEPPILVDPESPIDPVVGVKEGG